MAPQWDPIDLTSEPFEEFSEDMGTKEKYWVHPKGTGELWLVKLPRRRDDADAPGEDWAEWLVHHLATEAGIPTATVRPTRWNGARAIASLTVLSNDADQLVHGNSLLFGRNPEYDRDIARHNDMYTPAAVQAALDNAEAPQTFRGPAALTGYDVWAGYLLLDAWVAGRDRHHENWGIIRSGDLRHLSPSFDHGNALGFAETESNVNRLTQDPEALARWLAKGTSHHFAGRPTLVDLALEALGLATPLAGAYWLERLGAIDPKFVQDLVSEVPVSVMSDVRRTFIVQLLEANRRRLLDGYRAQVSG
jgi:hypothetical protein